MSQSRLLSVCVGAVVFCGGVLSAEDPAAAVKPGPEIKLTEASWDEIQKQVAQFSGKLVVVDLWSTACLPCMEEFPNLVKLQQQYGDRIVCVSVNVNYAGIKSRPPEYYRERVEKFLTEQKADIRNYLCSTEAAEVFEQIKLKSIPAVFVFGKDGKLAKRFDDSLIEEGEEEAFTYKDDINPFVKATLGE
ncbi:MAG: TlpA disulfide reductase family protein [Planctomycetaceae bacterium]